LKTAFLLFFSFFLTFSQNVSKKLDSLQLVLKNNSLSQVERVEVLNELASDYGEFDFDKAIFYNNQIFSISKREKYFKGYGYYYMNLADINILKSDFKEAERMAKKAQKYYLKANEINNYLLSIYANCFALEFQGEVEKAKKLVLFTIQRFENKPKNERIAELYYYLSTIYSDENKPKLAFLYVNKALNLYKKQKLENGILKSNFHLSFICYNNRMYKKSIFYLNYCNKMVKAKFNHKIEFHIKINYLYARNYVKLNQYRKALLYCNVIEKYRDKLNLQNEFTGDNLILIEIYTKLKKYSKALEYIKKVNASKLDYQDEEFEFNLLKGNYNLAINNYKEAYRLAKENYLVRPLDIENLRLLSASLIAIGDYKNAYLYQSKILKENDKNFESEKENRIAEYEALFQLKEKDLTINNKNLQVARQESEIQKQKSYVVISIVILIALLTVVVLLVNSYQIKRKSNQLLNAKNEELNRLNLLLTNSLKEKEVLLKEIHHRVKNNLQLVMSLLNIQAQDSQQVSIEDFLEKGQLRIATMSLIHQHLYLSDNFSSIDFQTYLQTLVENIKNTFNNCDIPIDIDTHGNTFDLDTAIPLGLIINEIVCNALKHAFPEDMVGRIQISIQKKDTDLFELLIGDNGVGTRETKKSNSIGLELVSLLVMQLQGKLKKINQLGTNYSIEFKQSFEY
jgi:two-component sensor histidine kinase